MPTAQLYLRDGIIPRLMKVHGFASETAFARAININQQALNRASNGKPASAKLVAEIASAFGYGLGEIAQARITDDAEPADQAA